MDTSTPPTPDLARVTLGVLVLALLVAGSLWILKPFLGAVLWATMVVVATWPTLMKLQTRLGGRRWLAITIMTVIMGIEQELCRHVPEVEYLEAVL